MSSKSNNQTKASKKVEKLKNLLAKLGELRNNNEKNRKIRFEILDFLGYQEKESISSEQFDAFIIKATKDCLGNSLQSDVILMTCGLLEGYDYHVTLKSSVRMKKYLEESDYLWNYPVKDKTNNSSSKECENENNMDESSGAEENDEKISQEDLEDIIEYSELNDQQKKRAFEKLRDAKWRYLKILAEFLLGQSSPSGYVKECFDYMESVSGYYVKNRNTGQIISARLPKPSYPQHNYERLIWLELKKSNRKLRPLQGMKETVEKGIEAIRENKDKITIGVSCFVLIFALSMLVLRQTSVETSTDDPLTPYNIKVARPIESYRKDDYSKTEHESKSMQNVKNNNNEDTVKVAKVSN